MQQAKRCRTMRRQFKLFSAMVVQPIAPAKDSQASRSELRKNGGRPPRPALTNEHMTDKRQSMIVSRSRHLSSPVGRTWQQRRGRRQRQGGPSALSRGSGLVGLLQEEGQLSRADPSRQCQFKFDQECPPSNAGGGGDTMTLNCI